MGTNLKMKTKDKRTKCEVYSRIVGYLRPVQQWNEGKQSEFRDRKTYKISNEKENQEKLEEV